MGFKLFRHALTCSKGKGSLGHHFRVEGVDPLQPPLDAALKARDFGTNRVEALFAHVFCFGG